MRRSHHPPHQAAVGGLNFHLMRLMVLYSSILLQFSCLKRVSAPLKLVPLSVHNIEGLPLLEMNLFRLCRNVSVDKEVSNSKCTALYTAHVNKVIHAFCPSLRKTGPAKSTPVISNTAASRTLNSGKTTGAVSSLFVLNLLQVPHLEMTDLIVLLPVNIQTCSLKMLNNP